MNSSRVFRRMALAGLSAVIGLALVTATAQAQTSPYGCFKVVKAKSLHSRRLSFSRSRIVGVAVRGQKLAKWKRFCAFRGFWCPVRTKAGVRGFADKRYLKKVSCS